MYAQKITKENIKNQRVNQIIRNILTKKDLTDKNEFVLALRDHLASIYQTDYHYTYGKDELGNPKNISGFHFRKDLCNLLFLRENMLTKKIQSFAEANKLETQNKEKYLTINFKQGEYIISTHIGKGCADNMSIYFIKSGDFELPNISTKEYKKQLDEQIKIKPTKNVRLNLGQIITPKDK